MDVELICTIDDKTILDRFKNIKLVLGIETKYNRESSDEYILFYPVEDEVEVNIDTEYIEPNIIYSNSNLQIFFNKENPYCYHIGKTHALKRSVFIGFGHELYNLFTEVLTAKDLIKKDNEDLNIVVTKDMREAINDTVVIFDVEPCETGYSISNVNVVGWSKKFIVFQCLKKFLQIQLLFFHLD